MYKIYRRSSHLISKSVYDISTRESKASNYNYRQPVINETTLTINDVSKVSPLEKFSAAFSCS